MENDIILYNTEYRIRESRYGFRIEKKVKETTGRLWWKKTVTKWVLVNDFGEPDKENALFPFVKQEEAVNFLRKIGINRK